MKTGTRWAMICVALTLLSVGRIVDAQSLFQRGEALPAGTQAPNLAEPLYAVSLFAIEPPQARVFRENDLITIVVRETSRFRRSQSLETEKEYENTISMLNSSILRQFLELRLPTDGQRLTDIDLASSTNEFEGEGDYDRSDQLEARITARILEVKPNGTLLLEARNVIQTDDEVQTVTLSGLCRSLDITSDNTVLSSQLFDLHLNVQHEGEIKKSTQKGLIPRVIETIFNF